MQAELPLYIPLIKPSAQLRLICFPYAGGTSSSYISWAKDLDSNVELVVVQLPGRGSRLSEAPYKTMDKIVEGVYIALKKLPFKPYILYGHSLGARAAYELTVALYRMKYMLPIHLVAAASAAPNRLRTKPPISHLPEREFIERVSSLSGVSEFSEYYYEIMKLNIPSLRADFRIVETYRSSISVVLPTTISVLAGEQDDIDEAALNDWFSLFQSKTGIHWIEGGHFFVDKNKSEVIGFLNSLVDKYMPRLPNNLGELNNVF